MLLFVCVWGQRAAAGLRSSMVASTERLKDQLRAAHSNLRHCTDSFSLQTYHSMTMPNAFWHSLSSLSNRRRHVFLSNQCFLQTQEEKQCTMMSWTGWFLSDFLVDVLFLLCAFFVRHEGLFVCLVWSANGLPSFQVSGFLLLYNVFSTKCLSF